jgi:hypothetical protein
MASGHKGNVMTTMTESMGTTDVTKRIRKALKARSGKAWSVTRGRGTARGWITIQASSTRSMTDAERAELGELLGLSKPVHCQGEMIPSGHDYYREYIDRAEGREPRVTGTPYWD